MYIWIHALKFMRAHNEVNEIEGEEKVFSHDNYGCPLD